MSATQGILYVTMQPKTGLSIDQFHEWYNNEHGPTRLRIPHIFANGIRYAATDGHEPTFLAAYDIKDMSLLETETYLQLRANRSPREAETIGQVDVKRYFYDLVHSKESPNFTPIENLPDEEAAGIQTVAFEIFPNEEPEAAAEYQKWMLEEHIEMLSKVPGWLRTRLFKTSSLVKDGPVGFLTLDDFAKENGQDGPEHKAAKKTPRRSEVLNKYIGFRGRRAYSPFYSFGPAPRELASLSRLPPSGSVTFPDGKTTTHAGPGAAIDSYITTADSLEIRYRLEGNTEPNAPTVAFSNSLLTSLKMWDPLVEILKKERPDLRILRYDTRGRHAVPQPPVSATLDTLADDLRTVIDALRIPKLHALVGVSMGGATTLNFAIKYPTRLEKFIACDFNAVSSPANTQAWKDRTAQAEEDNGKGIEKLAEQTVGRWFHPDTMEKKDIVEWMTKMVAANHVEGFKHSNTALWDYDLKGKMGDCPVPGLFVVGEGDAKGALPKAMDGFRGLLGSQGGELKIVPATGHLPMCEDPEAFWEAVKSYL